MILWKHIFLFYYFESISVDGFSMIGSPFGGDLIDEERVR